MPSAMESIQAVQSSVDITVTPVNDNTPDGVADAYGPVQEGATLNVLAASGVLDNDSDLDGNPMFASLDTGPSYASSFALNADGSFSYTHNDSENFTDSFTYIVDDTVNFSPAVTVTLSITPDNDEPPVTVADAYGVAEGGNVSGTAGLSGTGVLGNDSDADLPGDNLNVFVASPPSYAAAFTLNADGSFSYDNNGSENFADSFTYTVSDGVVTSAAETVTITVTPVSDETPVVVDDAYAVDEGGTVSGTAGLSGTGVLGNDSDADLPGDNLTVSVGTPPAYVSAFSVNSDGSFSYTHDNSENLVDSFTYTVSDGVNTSAVATVNFNINPVNDNTPAVTDDAYALAEGGSISGTGGTSGTGVLGNDSDGDLPAETLTVTQVGGTSNGALTLNGDGSFNYTHDGSENLTDTFTYTVSDGVNTSAVATATLTMSAVNDNSPIAVADAYVVAEGFTINLTAGLSGTGVQGNDSDTDLPGDTISVSEVNGVPGNVGSPVVLSTGTVHRQCGWQFRLYT